MDLFHTAAPCPQGVAFSVKNPDQFFVSLLIKKYSYHVNEFFTTEG